MADALQAIIDKLVRRHPHVFGAEAAANAGGSADSDAASGSPREPVSTPGRVKEQWERVKAREREQSGERQHILSGVPRALPSLLRAYEIGSRAAAIGFDWPRADDVIDKIEEEVRELREASANEGAARTEEEMGDLLFTLVNLARKLGVEPESALRRANDKFVDRFEGMERGFDARGHSIHDASPDDLEREWARVKAAP